MARTLTPQAEHNGTRCSAHTKASGGTVRCKSWAILGGTVCIKHGGAAGQVKAKAQARLLAGLYGLPREAAPAVILYEELWRTNGHVGLLDLAVHNPETTVDPGVLIRHYEQERKHLVEIASTCVKMGIDERLIRIEEDKGRLVADIFRRVFAAPELGLTGEQQSAALVMAAGHLRLIAGGGAA